MKRLKISFYFIFFFLVLISSYSINVYAQAFNYSKDFNASTNFPVHTGYNIDKLNDGSVLNDTGHGVYWLDSTPPYPPTIIAYLNVSNTGDTKDINSIYARIYYDASGSSYTWDFEFYTLLNNVATWQYKGYSDGDGKPNNFNVTFTPIETDSIMLFMENFSKDGGSCESGSCRSIWIGELIAGGTNHTVAGGLTPSLSLETNLENDTSIGLLDIPFIFYFNGTSINNTNIYNCSFYVNSTLNQSKNLLNLTDNNNFTIDFNPQETTYSFNVTCINENATSSFIRYKIEVDTIEPELTISSNFVNESSYYDDTNIIYNVTISDTNLFAINHTIRDNAGNLERWDFYENLTITNFILNVTNSTELLGIGNHTIFIEAWDSHTVLGIPSYQWEKVTFIGANNVTYKGITFNKNKFNMSTNDQNMINNWTLEKIIDRYKLDINFKESELNKNFDIFLQAKNQIIYLPQSKHNGHFIIDYKHWLDFNTNSNITDFSIIDLGIAYRIRFKPQQTHIVFNSIGDLNYKNMSWTFTIEEAPDLNTLLLTDINNTNTDINNTLNNIYIINSNIEEGITMLWIILIPITLLIIGFISKHYIISSLSGLLFAFVGTLQDEIQITITLILIGTFLFIVSPLFYFLKNDEKDNFNNKKKFNYYEY